MKWVSGGVRGHMGLFHQLGIQSCPVTGSRGDILVRARAADRAGALGSEHHRKTVERILRYPNGDTRRIRYPVAESDDEEEGELWTEDLYWGSSGSNEKLLSMGVESKPKQTELPSSPAELIRYLNSDAYREAQKELKRRIKDSYEIMGGCPWVAPRPLFVLTVGQRESDDPLTYTLPTRVRRNDTAEELSKILNKKGIFDVGEVLDGVITFENSDDAERFQSSLEAEGHAEARIFEVDSHELFKNTQEARAVVVLMDCSDYSPFPLELGISLRGHTSLEE